MGSYPPLMLIDPDPASRAEIEAMLAAAPVSLVATSGYGVDATSQAQEAQPQLILAAVEAPVERALKTVQAVAALCPDSSIILYSIVTDVNVMRRAMQLGVTDFLARPVRPSDLLAAIERTAPPPERDAADGADRAPGGARAAGVVVTVYGAKGGIGKTTLVTNLAASIVQDTDLSVLILDMDARFGDVAIAMELEPRFTVADLAARSEELDRELYLSALARHSSGVAVLAAPNHPSDWADVTAAQIRTLIEFGARLFDYVIVDAPGTFNDLVDAAIEVADRVLIVSSLDMSSIKDTALMLDILAARGVPRERLLLTVNQVNRANTVVPADVARIVHQPIFCHIPYGEQVPLASQHGQPVVLAKPKARAAKRLHRLGREIAGLDHAALQARQGSLRRWLPARLRS